MGRSVVVLTAGLHRWWLYLWRHRTGTLSVRTPSQGPESANSEMSSLIFFFLKEKKTVFGISMHVNGLMEYLEPSQLKGQPYTKKKEPWRANQVVASQRSSLLKTTWRLNTWKGFNKAGMSILHATIQYTRALFGCSQIHINPYILRWVEVKLELNSTPIHFNTCGLRWIRQHPNKV